MLPQLKNYVSNPVEAAPLAVFRILFGSMVFLGLARFAAYGWIDKLYVRPKFFFSYYGFEWIRPLGNYTYILFLICAIACVMVTLGYKYRVASIVLFLSFTYIELMDKTTYLNHYYFTSILAFLMIFLPANVYYSMDALKNPKKAFQKIPAWTINSVKLLLAIVYFYAGLAKLNSDWLIEAMPLKIWLPSKFDIPLVGDLFHFEGVAQGFSWGGAIYDLTIPFFLLYRKTRLFAFVAVVVFHLATWVLFPIGMFPFIMIASTLIFFDSKFHHKILGYLDRPLPIGKKTIGSGAKRFERRKKIFEDGPSKFDNGKTLRMGDSTGSRMIHAVVILFFVVQLLFPFRYLAYPGELFWTEEGYRFSWRVMLMEKSGYAQFKIVDGETGRWFYVDNTDFLTPLQEKQMAFQPDFILEYAHHLKSHFEKDGHREVAVYVDSRVSLNGRLSVPFIDPEVDLAHEKESFEHKKWILPFKDEISGM